MKKPQEVFAASYSLLTDVMVYPVLNESVFYLDDFPSLLPVETEHISNVVIMVLNKVSNICWPIC